MKKQILLFITVISIVTIAIIFSIFLGSEEYSRILLAAAIIVTSFFSLYMFFGIGKFVSGLIYGAVLAIALTFLANSDMEIIFIGTFIFFLNPLHSLEDYVNSKFKEKRTIVEYLRGSYVSYYDYRKKLKEHYHLPQVRKTFTKPYYLMARRALTIIMAMVAIFLLIREVNNLINLFKNFNIHLFFTSSYSIILLLLLTVLLYRKGFQSMTNLLTVSIFPPIAYFAFLAIDLTLLSYLVSTLIGVIGIVVGVVQYVAYRHRIIYEYYYYFDQEKLHNVYANALFEPYVYDENFRLTTTFEIKVDQVTFNKNFQSIVVFADFNRFFITAYTVTDQFVTVYTDFHYRDENHIVKFKHYLESLFGKSIRTKMVEDKTKELYEKEFFHNNDYIIARTVYLANILKKLEIKSSVIVGLTVYFDNLDNLEEMAKKYYITRLEEYDIENVYTAKISLRIVNVDYIIENKMREILLDLLINKGSYIRVTVYY